MTKKIQPEEINLFFNDRCELLKLYNTQGNVIKYLLDKNKWCKLINAELSSAKVKKLGEGNTAIVMKITIAGDGSDKKSSTYALKIEKAHKGMFVLSEQPNFILPMFQKGCIKSTAIERLDHRGKTILDDLAIVCENTSQIEYLIGSLMSQLYYDGVSINFIDIISFSTCVKDNRLIHYTLMELIDTSLLQARKCFDKQNFNGVIDCILIQTIHAIAVYSKLFNVVHNDLHVGNLFIKMVNKNMTWKGKKLIDADYYSYVIGDTTIYFEAQPYIIKIGDWEYSVKYSPPIVGSKEVLLTGMIRGSNRKPWMPNFYSENYDLMYFLFTMYNYVSKTHSLLNDMIKWVFDISKASFITKKMIFPQGRPDVENLYKSKDRNPVSLLCNAKIMGKFYKKPIDKNIIELGKI